MKNYSEVLIVSGGSKTSDIILKNKENRYIIAVDSGAEILYKLKIEPDIVIGDLDSIKEDIKNNYIKKGIKIIKANCEKDETDTELAIEYAIKKGVKDLVILGATGSRLDHTLGNMLLLRRLSKNNVKSKIVNENNEISYILGMNEFNMESIDKEHYPKRYEYKKDSNYKYISIIPIKGDIKGITLEGFKYNLNNADIKSDSVIGISNEIVESSAYIKICKGSALVIRSKD